MIKFSHRSYRVHNTRKKQQSCGGSGTAQQWLLSLSFFMPRMPPGSSDWAIFLVWKWRFFFFSPKNSCHFQTTKAERYISCPFLFPPEWWNAAFSSVSLCLTSSPCLEPQCHSHGRSCQDDTQSVTSPHSAHLQPAAKVLLGGAPLPSNLTLPHSWNKDTLLACMDGHTKEVIGIRLSGVLYFLQVSEIPHL